MRTYLCQCDDFTKTASCMCESPAEAIDWYLNTYLSGFDPRWVNVYECVFSKDFVSEVG